MDISSVYLGRTPIVGDTVDAYGYTFEVIKMQGYRISRLRVTPLLSLKLLRMMNMNKISGAF